MKTPVNTIICIAAWMLAAMVGGCSGKNSEGTGTSSDAGGVTASKLLRISDSDDACRITVLNPEDTTQVLARYLLVDREKEVPADAGDATVVRTPVGNVVVYSSVYAGPLDELGAIDVVKGVADAGYFKIPAVRKRIDEGRIVDVGVSSNPSSEKIISLKPDLILTDTYTVANSGSIEKMGIPVMAMADIMETTPTGRAEWIKVLGRLTGRGAKADSIFSAVDAEYGRLADKAKAAGKRPKVLTDNIFEGIWYVPAGGSYSAAMIADAGGAWPWADDKGVGALNLSYEQVLERAGDADVWLIKVYDKELTPETLLAMDGRYAHLKAFKERNVWYSNTATGFLFEEFPFHPELLLNDYIAIFHPEIEGLRPIRYFKKI